MTTQVKPHTVLSGLLVCGFTAKLALVSSLPGFLGVDGGAYMLSADYVRGLPQLADFTRPPLAPGWVLVPFLASFGDMLGLKIFHILASLAIIPPFYLFARLYLRPWFAVIASGFLLVDWRFFEMFIVGPLPMIGFGFMLLAMVGIHGIVNGKGWRHGGYVALGIPLIFFTNQTAAGISLYILPIYTLLTLWSNRGQESLKIQTLLARLGIFVFIGLLLTVPAYPYYIGVAPGSELLVYPGPFIYLSNDVALFYMLIMSLVILGASLVWGNRPIKALSLVLLATMLVVPWNSNDETVMNIFYRSRYLMTVFFYVCAVWLMQFLVDRESTYRWVGVPWLATVFGILIFGLGVIWEGESVKTQMVTAETAKAIQQIDGDSTVVTNNYSMALYVAALTRQPVTWAQGAEPPPAYAVQHERTICIFNWVEDCNPYFNAGLIAAKYVLAETRWPHKLEYSDGLYGRMWGALPDPWLFTDRALWLELVYSEGTTRLWRIKWSYAWRP